MATVDPALYRRLEALPETQIGEILRGDVVASPRPAPRHAKAIIALGNKIYDPYDQGQGGPGGWRIFSEPEVHLRSEVVVPDLAGWRRERMPDFPEAAAIDLPPDWVCEILSPNSKRRDRVIKRAIYAEHGVSFLWFIDPVERMLDVLELTEQGWLIDAIYAENDVARARPFDAIDLPLADLWPD